MCRKFRQSTFNSHQHINSYHSHFMYEIFHHTLNHYSLSHTTHDTIYLYGHSSIKIKVKVDKMNVKAAMMIHLVHIIKQRSDSRD